MMAMVVMTNVLVVFVMPVPNNGTGIRGGCEISKDNSQDSESKIFFQSNLGLSVKYFRLFTGGRGKSKAVLFLAQLRTEFG
jgi:hypothetical protein